MLEQLKQQHAMIEAQIERLERENLDENVEKLKTGKLLAGLCTVEPLQQNWNIRVWYKNLDNEQLFKDTFRPQMGRGWGVPKIPLNIHAVVYCMSRENCTIIVDGTKEDVRDTMRQLGLRLDRQPVQNDLNWLHRRIKDVTELLEFFGEI